MNYSERELQELLATTQVVVLENGQEERPFAFTSTPANGTAVNPSLSVKEEQWTETEKAFARQYLQPALERGEYVWYMAQVAVYMPGQTYTFDFVALRPDGGADHFEVKGKHKLGSQDRSSVKVRWATAFVQCIPDSPHRVFWARLRQDGNWQVRQIKLRKKTHPICS